MIHVILVMIYLAFIGLGLPDGMLGAAWPSMYSGFKVPISYAGYISMIIAAGTVVSSLLSDYTTKRFGTGKVTVVSIALTAVALFGFSSSTSFWMLLLWAIPYGLGAGSVDAALNNYVALHYAGKHMSWLHAMWGVGAAVGPNIMGLVMTKGQNWNLGYRIVSFIQIGIVIILLFRVFSWEKDNKKNEHKKAFSFLQILRTAGAKEMMLSFFCYCAIEQTVMLWGSSYLVLHCGISKEIAAGFASMFLLGITIGRVVNGFFAIKFSDKQMIHMGQALIAMGVLMLMLSKGNVLPIIGLLVIGIGCAPIYPCIIHSTPANFGKERSQALIGAQMASAYLGTVMMPPIFGFLANHIGIWLFPIYIFVILIVMVMMYGLVLRKTGKTML